MVVNDEPYLLEYNVRFGDPECQTLMMRFQGDMLKTLKACAEGDLDDVKGEVSWAPDPAMCVVMAANGYPASYEKGTVIKNLAATESVKEVTVFHAGTDLNEQDELVNVGGRVLGVTAKGDTLKEAHQKAYEAIAMIDWPDGFNRSDIGWRALAEEKAA